MKTGNFCENQQFSYENHANHNENQTENQTEN